MAKSLEKLKALSLRRAGMSVGDIAKTVRVSKSTASLWCREASLTKKQKDLLYRKMVSAGHKGRLLGAISNRNKKLGILDSVSQRARREVSRLSKRDLSMLALGLYWGEGSKDKGNKFVFVNSDPDSVLLIITWLRITMNISVSDLKPQIYINIQHIPREKEVIAFWSEKLKLSKSQFGRTIFIKVPHKKIYENYSLYMGVLHLTVAKSSYLKYFTMALLMQTKRCVQKF